VERTRLLVHVLDLKPLDGSDPVENHATVESELASHGAGLEDLPRILCLSKADLVPPEAAEAELADWQERLGIEVVVTSAATGQGLDELVEAIFRAVPEERPAESLEEAPAEHRVYRPGGGEGFRVRRLGDGTFRVSGGRVERLIARHDMDNEDAQRYVEDRLRSMGVIRALESAGFEPGDDVEIGGMVFELDPA
jgi:GTP-binding protein